MTRRPYDDKNPPVSLEERYAVAVNTTDLGLPNEEGATGAQGVLAAAAWSEVSMGSPLRRLRSQWDSARPRRRVARPVSVLTSAGLSTRDAKRQHKRERIALHITYRREKEALQRRIPEYAIVLEALVAEAVHMGIDRPEVKAFAVLDEWLEDAEHAPIDPGEARLWTFLRDCYNAARQALVQGMRGHTKHENAEG